jgi:2-dehydro-3-deoxygluconokinase
MVLTFGEIMLRLSTPGHQRFSQCLPGSLGATFGGGEANVAVSLAHLGDRSAFMTAVPDNAISACLLAELRRYGVDTARVQLAKNGRFGIYFVETGSNQRPGVVVYDRAGSSVALAGPADYDFKAALEGVDWLHTTGITPSLSQPAFAAALALCREAAARKIPVSVDLNFRKKLWRWDPGREPKKLARDCMTELLQHVSLVIANEEDAADVLGIHAAGSSVESGTIAAAGYIDVAREIARRFPSVQQVAITLRESYSADHNNWGAMLYSRATDSACFAPLDGSGTYQPYAIRDIVDRVGGGDSFGAGLIHALRSERFRAPQDAIRFAVAASALKHTITGDFNLVTAEEVEALMLGSGSGRVQR